MNPKKEKDTKPSLLTISITIMNHVDFFFFFGGYWGLQIGILMQNTTRRLLSSGMRVITAQAKINESEESGSVFAHCN